MAFVGLIKFGECRDTDVNAFAFGWREFINSVVEQAQERDFLCGGRVDVVKLTLNDFAIVDDGFQVESLLHDDERVFRFSAHRE
jgi:hypothetical protein